MKPISIQIKDNREDKLQYATFRMHMKLYITRLDPTESPCTLNISKYEKWKGKQARNWI